MTTLDLHPDRLFPVDPGLRALARSLYATVATLPIVSPHGHTDPQWYADDTPFVLSMASAALGVDMALTAWATSAATPPSNIKRCSSFIEDGLIRMPRLFFMGSDTI